MKVIYRPRKRRPFQWTSLDVKPVLELSFNSWDDYTYKTTFDAVIHVGSSTIPLDQVKVYFSGVNNTSAHLEKLIEEGWDGEFPPPEANYISNPTSITFYEQIIGGLNISDAAEIAGKLRDASFLTRLHDDDGAIALTATEGFRRSLLRERGEQNAFSQGWKLFSGLAVSVDNVGFRFSDQHGSIQDITFKFATSSLLPHDVNLLIGPNGAGKSQLLTQLVDHWLQVEGRSQDTGFIASPTFNRFIAVSYSPFERLRVDTVGLTLASPDVYRYFGLRGRSPLFRNQISLSLGHARKAAARSLLFCAEDDQRFSAISAWSQKLRTLNTVLQQAIDFDFAAVEVPATASGRSFLQDKFADDPTIEISRVDNRKVRYVRIDEFSGREINVAEVGKHLVAESGVTLFKNSVPVALSSGQQLFSYIVINILGSIRRNSFVLIDEPELFLHPTLEIELISMLKTILESYSSKALIATHSLILTREVPHDCVHVFHPTDEALFIKHPPFQTFGGDVQRISSYVFGDNSVSKPFEKWIEEQVAIYGSRRNVLAHLHEDDLNEELIIELTSGEDLTR